MPKYHRPLAAATLAAAALAPAGLAQAATKTVDYGPAGKPPAGLPETAALFDFFPRKVTIHAGDKVRYRVNGFGLVYSGPASKVPALAALDPSAPVSGSNDPAGNPFWFNGQPSPFLNGAVLARAGDGKVEKGQKDVDHDALALGPPKPYVLSFAKPGTYKVRDALHPDVVNTVKVVKKGKTIPGKAADKSAVVKQTAKLVEEAQRLEDVTAPGNTILVGNDSRHVGFFQFFPPAATVKVGQPVTIDAGKRMNDVHNLAIGPEAYMKQLTGTLFGEQPGAAGLPLNPAGVYPSQPTAPLTYGGGAQEFVNTGFLDTDAKTPLASKTSITFTKAGTYTYVCNIHSDGVQGMTGTIEVQQ